MGEEISHLDFPRAPRCDSVSYESVTGGAEFGPMGTDDPHRYRLWRNLRQGIMSHRLISFVLLNPSTATHTEDDPTIRRCIGYARAWGFGVMQVLNIFALRSTWPKALYDCPEEMAIGALNDLILIDQCRQSERVVCGWGVHGELHNRGGKVRELIIRNAAGYVAHGWKLNVLGLTKDGHPKHPLYLKKDLQPVHWESP